MSWNLQEKKVSGKYLGEIPFSGVVINSRVAYGRKIKHNVKLDDTINVYGVNRKEIIIETNEYGESVNFEIND